MGHVSTSPPWDQEDIIFEFQVTELIVVESSIRNFHSPFFA